MFTFYMNICISFIHPQGIYYQFKLTLNSSTALRYIKLKQVVNPAGAAAKLADLNVEIGKTYMSLNNLKGFSQAFRE